MENSMKRTWKKIGFGSAPDFDHCNGHGPTFEILTFSSESSTLLLRVSIVSRSFRSYCCFNPVLPSDREMYCKIN